MDRLFLAVCAGSSVFVIGVAVTRGAWVESRIWLLGFTTGAAIFVPQMVLVQFNLWRRYGRRGRAYVSTSASSLALAAFVEGFTGAKKPGRRNLFVIELDSARLVWSTAFANPVASNALAADTVVTIAADGMRVVSLTLSRGAEVLRLRARGRVAAP